MTQDDVQAGLSDPWWRLCNLYWIVDKDGRPIRFEPNVEQANFFKSLHTRNAILKARQKGFCLDPDTRILTADLRWVPISEIEPGVEVVAVDENIPGGKGPSRKMLTATVQAKRMVMDEAYRITFDDGRSVVCTAGHRWLSRSSPTVSQTQWRKIDGPGKTRLKPGCLVRWITKPWEAGDIEDGWFSGMLDGEGSISKANSSAGVKVTQRPGPVFERMNRYIDSRSYNACFEGDNKPQRPSKHGITPVPSLAFGRLDEMFRLIGQTRPTRFVGNRFWEGRNLPGKRTGKGWATIVTIEKLPSQPMVDLQTSSGTFIAEGFVSHNSTLMQIIALDQCLFNDNFTANTIADTLPNAGKLFRKAAYAYMRLPDAIKANRPLKSDTTTEMVFANGSSFSVGTSARGGTVQFLHISEMGKIAKKYPQKAREIVTGAFEAVPLNGVIVVESTAEGNGGEFFDICDVALKAREEKAKLTGLDFKLHFYPWYDSAEYRIDPAGVILTDADRKYFREIEVKAGVTIDASQRAWYVKKRVSLKRDMKREYPATIKESFEQAVEGAVYGEEMTFMREKGRICSLPIDQFEPVNTFWDLGSNDHTAIWLHQRVGQWNHFVGYMQGTRTGLRKWWQALEDWREANQVDRWGRHYLPHDGEAERQGEEIESAKTILEGLRVKNIEIVPRVAYIAIGIDKTRTVLTKNVRIDPVACIEGIKCLDSYQFEWDDKLGQWRTNPLHNWASNGADAFRQFAQGYTNIDDRIVQPKSWRDRLTVNYQSKGSAQAA